MDCRMSDNKKHRVLADAPYCYSQGFALYGRKSKIHNIIIKTKPTPKSTIAFLLYLIINTLSRCSVATQHALLEDSQQLS